MAFDSFSNFEFLKACYDALLSTYNQIVLFFKSTKKTSSTFFGFSRKEERHICTAGCGLGGCAYGEKHKTDSYQKARNLFCSDSLFQPKKSFSYVVCQDGDNVQRVRV